MQRHIFTSDQGQILFSYKYFRNLENIRGVVVIAHSLDGGGHNSYMDVADFSASNGYVVFAYDATGNDGSEGSSVKGIPQGLVYLDYAIQFMKQTSDHYMRELSLESMLIVPILSSHKESVSLLMNRGRLMNKGFAEFGSILI